MKATMNAQGVITLRPETGEEAFALRQWISMAEETTYVDEPGALQRKPIIAWSQSMLLVQTAVEHAEHRAYDAMSARAQARAFFKSGRCYD
jgi:hypothetical protein